MVGGETGNIPYYTVYIEDGVLKCAPFGIGGVGDPILEFENFSFAN